MLSHSMCPCWCLKLVLTWILVCSSYSAAATMAQGNALSAGIWFPEDPLFHAHVYVYVLCVCACTLNAWCSCCKRWLHVGNNTKELIVTSYYLINWSWASWPSMQAHASTHLHKKKDVKVSSSMSGIQQYLHFYVPASPKPRSNIPVRNLVLMKGNCSIF